MKANALHSEETASGRTPRRSLGIALSVAGAGLVLGQGTKALIGVTHVAAARASCRRGTAQHRAVHRYPSPDHRETAPSHGVSEIAGTSPGWKRRCDSCGRDVEARYEILEQRICKACYSACAGAQRLARRAPR